MSKNQCPDIESVSKLSLNETYKIEKFIGAGGMACVYAAREQGAPNLYALKVLRDELRSKHSLLERFRQEAESMMRLQYPNIVRFYRFVEREDCAYIVMDYIDGYALSDLIRKHRSPKNNFPVSEAVRITVQIARAINYLHNEGFIHRDIKPGNILLRGGDGFAFLTDLGIVMRGDEDSKQVFAGTPAYMSPEQLDGGVTDRTTDIYAFAIVLYEMLTGQRPFQTKSVGSDLESIRQAYLSQHMANAFQPVSALRPDLPSAIDDILLRAINPTSSERYQSIMQFARELHAVLKDLLPNDLKNFDEIEAIQQTDSRAYKPQQKQTEQKPQKKSPIPFVLIATTLIIALLGGLWLITSPPEQNTDTDSSANVALADEETVTPVITETIAVLTEPTAAISDSESERHVTTSPTVIVEQATTDMEDQAIPTLTISPDRSLETPEQPPAIVTSVATTAVPTFEIAGDAETEISPTDTPPPPPSNTSEPPTLTATPTITASPTLIPTQTPIPTAFLNDMPFLPFLSNHDDLIGVGTDFNSAVATVLNYHAPLVPLRVGDVNGFSIELILHNTSGLDAYGLVYRLQDKENYALLRVDAVERVWQLARVQSGQLTATETHVLENLPDRLIIQGFDQFFRIEIADLFIQRELSLWDNKGAVALYFETSDDGLPDIAQVSVLFVGEDAVRANEIAPTSVAPIISFAALLRDDLRALKSTADADISVDCVDYLEIYNNIQRYLVYPETAELVEEVVEINALVYNRCDRHDTERTLDFNANYAEFLAWESGLSALIAQLESS